MPSVLKLMFPAAAAVQLYFVPASSGGFGLPAYSAAIRFEPGRCPRLRQDQNIVCERTSTPHPHGAKNSRVL
jgi:hypothetical protein